MRSVEYFGVEGGCLVDEVGGAGLVRFYVVGCEGKSKAEFARRVMCVGVGMGRGGVRHE